MGPQRVSIVAVTDTGPLIHLAEVDALTLLETVDELLVPETVYEELTAGGLPTGYESIETTRVTADTDSIEGYQLDPGETAALAIAIAHEAILLTDDLAARDTATSVGVEVHGSIGIIARGYAKNRLDHQEAAELMRALQHETSLFLTDAVVEQGIALLEADENDE